MEINHVLHIRPRDKQALPRAPTPQELLLVCDRIITSWIWGSHVALFGGKCQLGTT